MALMMVMLMALLVLMMMMLLVRNFTMLPLMMAVCVMGRGRMCVGMIVQMALLVLHGSGQLDPPHCLAIQRVLVVKS